MTWKQQAQLLWLFIKGIPSLWLHRHVTTTHIRDIAVETLQLYPPTLRAKLQRLPLEIKTIAPGDLLGNVLGTYHGGPILGAARIQPNILLARIELYRRPILMRAGSRWKVLTANVYRHEVGHALGMDHERLECFGMNNIQALVEDLR